MKSISPLAALGQTELQKKTPPASSAPAPAKKTAPPVLKAVVDLVAWKRPLMNPRILTCHEKDKDPTNPRNLVTVRVKNNLNFLPGMAVPARFVSPGIYDLEGPLPRYRGKW